MEEGSVSLTTAKGRRVLGEVQSDLNRLHHSNVVVAAPDAKNEKLECEKRRLVGELKALALEKEQMNVLLQEELDVRRMIQIESRKLIADIKSSYEHKISKLRNGLRTNEEDDKVVDSSALLLLQEQLAVAQKNVDDTKEALDSERSRVAQLSTALADSEKSFGLSKVDIRILTREKLGLEARLATRGETVDRLTTELDELRSKNSQLEGKLSEQEKKGEEVGKAKEEAEYHLETAKREKEAALGEKSGLEQTVVELKQEITKLKESLASFGDMKSSSDANELALKKKEEELEAATRKISSLQENVGLLKQTSTILSNQLKEFEARYGKKLKEFQELEGIKTKLLEENLSLKESLQFSKIDLNEALSLKSFFERRVSELESSAKASATCAAESTSALTSKITELTSKNAELKDIGNKLATELEAVSGEKNCALSNLDEARADNLTITREIHNTMEIIFELKHQISEMESRLEEVEEAEDAKIDELNKRWAATLQTKDVSNLQLQCKVEQQAKLIDFLQQQIAELSQKKKGFGGFFSRDKEKEEYTPVKKGVTLPRNVNFDTPTSSTGATPFTKPSALTLKKCEDNV